MSENNDDGRRKIPDEELQEILEKHRQWVESDGKEGECADLSNADLREANLWKANLVLADLTGADLWQADLRGAKLQGAYLLWANLYVADLTGADLRWADLRGAKLQGADLKNTNVTGVEYDRKTEFLGINVDGAYGSARFKRFAQDQDFIEELRWGRYRRGKLIYYLWLVSADCGRTSLRWILWSILFALGFGWIFYMMGPDAFDLKYLPGDDPMSYIYYSVVTFTTLGFGDIIPKTIQAARWVMAEVIIGYVMLGGLISILATKLARRS